MVSEGNHCHATATSHKNAPTKPSHALLSHLDTMFCIAPLWLLHVLFVNKGGNFPPHKPQQLSQLLASYKACYCN